MMYKCQQCEVCCDTFDKKRKRIVCSKCNYNNCDHCVRRAFDGSTATISCMNCKHNWTEEDISNNMGKKYRKTEFREKVKSYYINKEKDLLPSTQDYAVKMLQVEKLQFDTHVMIQERKELLKKAQELQNKINENKQNVYNMLRETYEEDNKERKTNEIQKKVKCPLDNCFGYLNDFNFCSLCNKEICLECMENKDKDHVCNEEKKESITLIQQDSKSCPKCSTLIFKTDGCDQMYCVSCHTAFSWNTGAVEKGRIHNPEYYRWMRDNNKEIPREQEQDLEDPIYVRSELCKIFLPVSNENNLLVENEEIIKLLKIHRCMNTVNMMNRVYQGDSRMIQNNLKVLRAKYILKKINYEEWTDKLEKNYVKQNRMNNEITIWRKVKRCILISFKTLLNNITLDILMDDFNFMEHYKKIENDMSNIRTLANEKFVYISQIYNSKKIQIDEEWKLIR